MRKLTVKIAIMFFAFIATIIAALSTLVLLINYGILTSFIENRFITNKDWHITLEDVHLDIFSGLELKQARVQGINNLKQFKLECDTVTIQYSLLDLLNRHLKSINLSDVQISLKVEKQTGAVTSSHEPLRPPYISDIRNFFPKNLLIDNISVNNINMQVTTGKYMLTLFDMDILANDIQSVKPFIITINGIFSLSDHNKESQSKLDGKIDIRSKFNLSDTKLTILNGSNILVNNLSLDTGKSTINAESLEIPIEATLSPFDPNSILSAGGKCVVSNGNFQLPNIQLTGIDLSTTFTLDYPNQITLSSKFINGNLQYNNAQYTINKLISNIKTNIDLSQTGILLFRSQINTNISDPASINGAIDLKSKIVKETSINIDNINCKKFSETYKAIIPEKYKEWSVNGGFSLDVIIETPIDKVVNNKPRKINTSSNLSFSKLKFSSPDYEYFGEGISGNIKMSSNTDYYFSEIYFNVNGTLDPFLIQLGTFTTDMKGRKSHLSIDGNYDIHKKHLTEINSTLSLDSLGAFNASGNIMNLSDKPQIDMKVEANELSNNALFETFVKDTVEYSNPQLFNSEIGGDSNAGFHVKGNKNNLSVDGHVNINGLNFEYGNTSIEGVNINLPVSIVYPRSGASIQKSGIPDSQYGNIQFRKLSYGPLEIDGIQFHPIIISNNLFIKDPFHIQVFDGIIDVENLSVENAINNDRNIKIEFQINNINLTEVASTYKLTPFEGTLNSSIMSFQQHKQKLYSKDEIKINLFGGDITISNLTLNNYLKTMREIGFSVEVKRLNLGKMSDTFREWGNITGIINGHIKNFKLVAGEPSSFELEMQTEKHPDIKQTVSTKFLKNFVPGIGNVLDKVGLTNYKYSVMGLRARLENDYIKLKGAVREGNKELFMKGAGMKKLEIVFPNVDRRVPFNTFLNSFKGILNSEIENTQVQFN